MSNKVQYAMPADEDDDDVIEDGDEMVDMQDSNEDEDMDQYDSDEDGQQTRGGHNAFENGNDAQAREVVDNIVGGNEMDSDPADDDEDDEDQDDDEEIADENQRPNGQVELNVNNAYDLGGGFQAKQIQNNMHLMAQNENGSGSGQGNARMRPQSAKTAPTNEQFRFQQQMQQQQPLQAQMMNQQHQPMGNWVNPSAQNTNLILQQQQMGPGGYSQQALLQGGFVNQNQFQQQPPNLFYPPTTMGKAQKRRPGTAGRRNQFKFGNKGFSSASNAAGHAPVSAKAQEMIQIEISKLRPKQVNQERERLYDDVMKQRMTTNHLKDENTKIKTRLFMVESELQKKDRVIDDLLLQQENNFGLPKGKYSSVRSGGVKSETHLVINLKRKVRDVQNEKLILQADIDGLKRNIRSTRLQELEVEVKLYMDECARLRHQLEEVIKSKDTFADPQELKIIEEKFQQRDIVIGQMQNENADIAQALTKKDEENRQLAELVQDMERRMKRAQASSKTNNKARKELKDKDREVNKIRKELIDLRHQNMNMQQQIKENKQSAQQSQPRPARIQSASIASQNAAQARNEQLQAENRRLQMQSDSLEQKIRAQNANIESLQRDLQATNEELVVERNDKVRFKDISEGYMQEVAKLEAQLEQADLKPKSKLSQRPKDTVMRDQSHSLSNIHTSKIKKVDAKQLLDVCALLKLRLQEKHLEPSNIVPLFFEPFVPEQEITIVSLKSRFDALGVPAKKGQLLARYLVEPQGQQEVVYNENAKATQQEVLQALQELVGDYKLYKDDESDEYNEEHYLTHEQCQRLVIERLGRHKQSFIDNLQCEDYDEEGMLDLVQLREAIISFDDDIDDHLIDYMIFYVFARSQSPDRMEYNVLIKLIEDGLQQTKRTQSATRKSRPESSSPEKLKLRNPDLKAKNEYGGLEGETYEDEDMGIAQDDDSDKQSDAGDDNDSQDGLKFGKDLGIDDLQKMEVTYLLRVLSKSELEGNILLGELLQIMQNFGLSDEVEDEPAKAAQEDRVPDSEEPTENSPEQPSGTKLDEDESNSSPDQQQPQKKKKKEKALDLGKLDDKSLQIMVMLMLHILDNNMTTVEFFQDVIYQQNVKSKTKQQTLEIMKAEDFFYVLHERQIKNSATPHPNLQEFLQLSPNFPHLIMVRNIKKTLEQMAENDNLMDAIREDALANEEMAMEKEAHDEELKRIEAGLDDSDESDGRSRAPEGAAIKSQDGLKNNNVKEDRRPGLEDDDDEDGYSDDKDDSDDEPHFAKQLDTVNEEDPQSKNQSKSNLGSGNLQQLTNQLGADDDKDEDYEF